MINNRVELKHEFLQTYHLFFSSFSSARIISQAKSNYLIRASFFHVGLATYDLNRESPSHPLISPNKHIQELRCQII